MFLISSGRLSIIAFSSKNSKVVYFFASFGAEKIWVTVYAVVLLEKQSSSRSDSTTKQSPFCCPWSSYSLFKHRVKSVSYTHLDVYKRQIIFFLIRWKNNVHTYSSFFRNYSFYHILPVSHKNLLKARISFSDSSGLVR